MTARYDSAAAPVPVSPALGSFGADGNAHGAGEAEIAPAGLAASTWPLPCVARRRVLWLIR